MNLKYKKVAEEDWELVASLESSVSNKYFHAFTQEKVVRDYLRKSNVFVIYLDGKPVGTASYEIKGKSHVQIEGVTVRPEYQRQGIAKQAMKSILEKVKGMERIDLAVHPKNVAAVGLYKKLGFEVECTKENYFGDGEPRLIMVKVP